MLTTGISFPCESIITALEAPLNSVKLLTASPLLPMKKPLLLPMSEPSAANVFKVKTDFVAFFTQAGWAHKGVKVRKLKSITLKARLCIIFLFIFIIIS